MRKSPARHTVRSHKRRNGRVQVRSYARGRGRRSQPARSRTIRPLTGKPSRAEAFTINFRYSGREGDGESVVVFAPRGEFEKALAEGLEEKVDSRSPVEVEIIDPSLGAALRFIGSAGRKAGRYTLKGIAKGGKVGAKYAVRVSKAGARATKKGLIAAGRVAKGELESKYVQHMIANCYSENKAFRFASRARLRKEYPQVYDLCDFSPT